jgi:hypothetical protein
MSANQCPCGVPVPDAWLCRGCAKRLERALGDLPALIADLDITLTRQAVTGPDSSGMPSATSEVALSLNLAAADVAHDLRHTLVSAIRHLSEARGIIKLPADNPTAMAMWLLKYHDSIRLDPAGPDIAEAVHGIKVRIMEVVDHPTTRSWFKVGMCPDDPCPGEVWVHLPAEDLGEPATMVCRACGHVWPTWEWNRTGMRILKRGAA